MKLLITGASGFIGRYAVEAAKARGWEYGKLDPRSPADYERVDARLLQRVDCDVILHLGAFASNAGFADAMAENYANNVFGFWNVLRLAQLSGARVVYASSSAVYGSNVSKQECCEDDALADGTLNSHYGRTKLINELMAASFPNTLGLRIFNGYGAGDELKPHCAPMAHFLRAKQRGEPMVVYGDGTQAKDFIHISDVAEIICRLIVSDATGIVNVGTGVATSFNRLAELIGGAVEYKPVPDPASYQFFTKAETTRLLSIIGPYEFKSVEEGLKLL